MAGEAGTRGVASVAKFYVAIEAAKDEAAEWNLHLSEPICRQNVRRSLWPGLSLPQIRRPDPLQTASSRSEHSLWSSEAMAGADRKLSRNRVTVKNSHVSHLLTLRSKSSAFTIISQTPMKLGRLDKGMEPVYEPGTAESTITGSPRGVSELCMVASAASASDNPP